MAFDSMVHSDVSDNNWKGNGEKEPEQMKLSIIIYQFQLAFFSPFRVFEMAKLADVVGQA